MRAYYSIPQTGFRALVVTTIDNSSPPFTKLFLSPPKINVNLYISKWWAVTNLVLQEGKKEEQSCCKWGELRFEGDLGDQLWEGEEGGGGGGGQGEPCSGEPFWGSPGSRWGRRGWERRATGRCELIITLLITLLIITLFIIILLITLNFICFAWFKSPF